MANNIAADDLATQDARASETTAFTKISCNILTSTPQGLKELPFFSANQSRYTPVSAPCDLKPVEYIQIRPGGLK